MAKRKKVKANGKRQTAKKSALRSVPGKRTGKGAKRSAKRSRTSVLSGIVAMRRSARTNRKQVRAKAVSKAKTQKGKAKAGESKPGRLRTSQVSHKQTRKTGVSHSKNQKLKKRSRKVSTSQTKKRVLLPLRVIPGRIKPSGLSGNKGRKRATPSELKRRKGSLERELARQEKRAQKKLEKLREKIRRAQRERALLDISRKTVLARLEGAKEWLEVVEKRAKDNGHRVRIAQAINRDSTSDLQLTVYDWQEPYREKLFDLFADLNDLLPNLGSGIKVRVQVRISDEGSPNKDRYKYLPMISGNRGVYYNYVHPDFVGNLFAKVEFGIDRLTEDGWKLMGIAVDVRFDPRWLLKPEERKV